MVPHTLISGRPKDIVATGKTSGYQRWMITEFKGKDGTLYYKYQRFNWNKRGDIFETQWYKENK